MNAIDDCRLPQAACPSNAQPIVVAIEVEARTIGDESAPARLFSGISVANAAHCSPEGIEAAAKPMGRLVIAISYLYHTRPVATSTKR